MMDRMSTRWVVVVVIWAAALAINYWNISEMCRIREAREKKVFLTMDEQFLRAHSEEISESLKKREAFFHSAEALNLGLLTVENELGALAARYDLAEVDVRSQLDQDTGSSIPVVLSCEGSLKNVVECLEALRRDHAYVPVTRVAIEIEGRGAPAKCEVRLNYRYRIVRPETQT
ncbi:MAG: hypothetical protein ACWGSD_05230 [Thermodesulfobacteriota bacterium]